MVVFVDIPYITSTVWKVYSMVSTKHRSRQGSDKEQIKSKQNEDKKNKDENKEQTGETNNSHLKQWKTIVFNNNSF